MLQSDRDPSLAINAWNGAQQGTVLRLTQACRSDNPDCTWTFRDGMFVSDSDPTLAINAWGGAQHGTVLQLHNACAPDNPDCTWLLAEPAGAASRTVPGFKEWDFGGGKHASSRGVLDRSTGRLSVRTTTWTNSPFQGFTVGMKVLLVNANGIVVWQSDVQQYGVDGTSTPFGSASNRRDVYLQDLDPALAATVDGMDIWLFHAPKWRLAEIIREVGDVAGDIVQAARDACSRVPEFCHLLTSLVAAPAAPEPVLVGQSAPLPVPRADAGIPPAEPPSDDAWDRSMEGYTDRIVARLEARDRAQLAALPREINGQSFELVVQTLQKWAPGQTVTVAFLGGDSGLHRDIAEAASEWMRYANLTLDFGLDRATGRYRQWSPADRSYAADIRIAFDDGGYWSLVGTDSIDPQIVGPGEPSMNLAGFTRQRPANWAGTVRHEFGHALGAQHEHQHPLEGCDMEFRWENEPGYVPTRSQSGSFVPDSRGRRPGIYQVLGGPPNNWPAYKVNHNLRQLENSSAFEFSPFDRESVMKYYFPTWMFVKGTESPCWTGAANDTLSTRDREFVGQFYPRARDRVAQAAVEREAALDAVLALPSLSGEQRQSFQMKAVATD